MNNFYIFTFILFETISLIYTYELSKIYNFTLLIPLYLNNILPFIHPVINYMYLIYISILSIYSTSFKIIVLEFLYLLSLIFYTIYPIVNELEYTIYDIFKNWFNDFVNEYVVITDYKITNNDEYKSIDITSTRNKNNNIKDSEDKSDENELY